MATTRSGRQPLSSPATAAATVSIKRVTFSHPSSATPVGSSRKLPSSGRAPVAVASSAAAAPTKTRGDAEPRKRRRHPLKAKSLSQQPLSESSSSSSVGLSTKRKMSTGAAGILAASGGGSTVETKKAKLPATPSSTTTSSEETSGGGEPDDAAASGTESSHSACPDYFGVKSYLHHFYEAVSVKNPDLYEDIEGGGAVGYGALPGYPMGPRKPRCRSLWWKLGVGFGINLLLLGVVVILIGYLVPRRQVVLGYQNELGVIDRLAVRYNHNLDSCKLIGMIMFCVGGTVVAVALLFPSFLYNYCDEDWSLHADQPFKAPPPAGAEEHGGGGGYYYDDDGPLRSPTEKTPVPVTEQVTRVQPRWDSVEPTTSDPADKLLH